jgi:Bacterial Ig-like domain (group 3)
MSTLGLFTDWWRGVRRAGMLLALIAFAALAFGNAEASAAPTFPSSPPIDNFATDTSLVTGPTNWTTPALGEGTMQLVPVAGSAAHELTGVDSGNWDAAIWNPPFTSPVEVWATINRAGPNDATLYANVTGGESGTMHPASGYFVDFGGTASGGSTSAVSLWRIDGPEAEVKLTSAASPYANLNAGDEIGLSDSSTGVLIAWYKPSGGSWSAVVSWRDPTYSSGKIAIEAIAGAAYGFSNFGGGTPTTPVLSAITTTSIGASAAGLNPGQPVTYTATVSPVPDGGTMSFADNGVPIPTCGAQKVNASGTATCTVTYTAPGTHVVTALYTGSPDGQFAGSTNGPDATVLVTAPTAPTAPPAPIGLPSKKLVATNTSLSLSDATPATRTAVRYTATVSPAPDGGTVSFTDSGGDIRGCTSQPVTNGTSTCTVTYPASGIHQIRAAYSGDPHFGGSDSSAAQLTVSTRPSLHVAKQSLTVTTVCPKQSGGCRLTSSVAVTAPGARKAINLKGLSAKLKAGKTGRFTFQLSARTSATLRSDLQRHHSSRLGVTVRIVVRDGNGSKGTQTLTFTVSGAEARSLLA